ncbi:hypothetical protein SINU_08930, partial [Sporolactobacillus inulinus CASD]
MNDFDKPRSSLNRYVATSDTNFSWGLAGTHQLGAIPQAPEHLRFDSWPRHWSIGWKPGQNHILSYPVRKAWLCQTSGAAKSPPVTAMDGLVFGEPQDAAFYRTTYTR